ncbi:excalibur calcium-binding domain-containing protein [Labrenzia sp. OB1]|uniref:excalibur calcium-binding domain-containing protein n=1 Tax=Labrenzia sp. OB1 TaxID=1561204 RepID=UPI0009EEA5B0|nr:excalibur calcium-binding domain-containing protein [Labrenzia sp. OB1]
MPLRKPPNRDRDHPDRNARRLKDRFKAVSNKSFRSSASPARHGWIKLLAVAVALVAAVYFALPIFSPWPRNVTLRHIVSFANCDTARAVGLAPANRGEPGYWSKLDADRDGIACEPFPR